MGLLLAAYLYRVWILSKKEWQYALATYMLSITWLNRLFLFLSPNMTTRELEEKVIENEIRDLESLVDEIESEKRNVLGLNFEIDAE